MAIQRDGRAEASLLLVDQLTEAFLGVHAWDGATPLVYLQSAVTCRDETGPAERVTVPANATGYVVEAVA